MAVGPEKIKGIAHDLANYLDSQLWFGYYKDLPERILTNALERKDQFDVMCVEFFKERLPISFDFSRVKKLVLEISRSKTTLRIEIKVKIDGREFSSKFGSTKA